MPKPAHCLPSPVRHVGALALLGGMASAGLAGAGAAGNGVQWRLHAHVPVVCAILDVSADQSPDTRLAITTSCNAQRYRLLLDDGAGQVKVRAALSSAGAVAVGAGAVTITSTRPGEAVTTIDLAEPAAPGALAVTLQPVQ